MLRTSLFMLMLLFITAPIAQSAASAETASPPVIATKGKMLVAVNGARLGQVYRVTPDGSVQIIIDGKMATVPASTLSIVNGELTTSLTKGDVIR